MRDFNKGMHEARHVFDARTNQLCQLCHMRVPVFCFDVDRLVYTQRRGCNHVEQFYFIYLFCNNLLNE